MAAALNVFILRPEVAMTTSFIVSEVKFSGPMNNVTLTSLIRGVFVEHPVLAAQFQKTRMQGGNVRVVVNTTEETSLNEFERVLGGLGRVHRSTAEEHGALEEADDKFKQKKEMQRKGLASHGAVVDVTKSLVALRGNGGKSSKSVVLQSV